MHMLRTHFKNVPNIDEPKDIDIAITALIEAVERVNKKWNKNIHTWTQVMKILSLTKMGELMSTVHKS